jgi:hypothetical protein
MYAAPHGKKIMAKLQKRVPELASQLFCEQNASLALASDGSFVNTGAGVEAAAVAAAAVAAAVGGPRPRLISAGPVGVSAGRVGL